MNKNQKQGYTLAEILIALAIIGVIAVVTIPNLITGVQSKKNAAMLGRSVGIMESGCRQIIQDASEKSTGAGFSGHYRINKSLDGSEIGSAAGNSISGSNLLKYASSYFGATTLSDNEKTSYTALVHSYNGETPSPAISSIASSFAANTDLGVYFGVNGLADSRNVDTILEYVYIDVNGNRLPNRYGVDVFLFGMTDSCEMVPAGSSRMKAINTNLPLASDACNGYSVTNGLSCTQRVVNDGFKIKYRD